MYRVALTGPTGAIGLALIEYYISQNIEVVAICRKNSKRIAHLPKSKLLKIYECDLEQLSELDIEEDCTFFFHLGWSGTSGESRNDAYTQMKNVEYAIESVRLAKRMKCQKYIGVGSQAEYGLCDVPLCADTPIRPQNAYGVAKYCASVLTKIEAEKVGMAHCWARVLSIYGPGDGKNTLISMVIHNLFYNRKVALTQGVQKWDYLYSADAAIIMDRIAHKGKNGNVYVVGSGKCNDLKEYIDIIADRMQKTGLLCYGEIPYSENQVMYLCANNRKIVEELGVAEYTPFEIGIDQTIAWEKRFIEENTDGI